ncbi:hypothetical protein [Priestia megaterium]|uniref:hypothetical protein n=1 Tax=Priestia megaterium TaxID=1404 RepID=UPI002E248505|nr:hypothetical protein [Priestia megaterium]
MNKLQESKYPFLFFPEEAFHVGQVINYVTNSYVNVLEQTNCEVVTPNNISMRDKYITTLGTVGRIVKLRENHVDLFHTESHNTIIRDLAVKYDGDLARVTLDFMKREALAVELTNEQRELLNHDIRVAFNAARIFYLDSEEPYHSLQFMNGQDGGSVFTEQNVKKLFRNIPIKEVW